jgi:hypothetical protein
MKYIGVKGDVIADLNEDLAADAAIIQTQQHGFLTKIWLGLSKTVRISCFIEGKKGRRS